MSNRESNIVSLGKNSDCIKIVQISDPHLFAKEDGRLLGVNTRESFMSTLESIRQYHSDIDAIVVTGDISQDYSKESYQFFAEQMNQFDCPVHCLAGNHDESKHLAEISSSEQVTTDKTLTIGKWKVLLANSQVKGQVYGLVTDEELEWLRQELSNDSSHSMVFVHHHPVNMNAQWIDKIGIQNAKELTKLLESFPQVKACGFGHVHQSFELQHQNIQYLAVPSTCVQFKPNSSNFAITEQLPGYRSFDCYSDGTFKTQVHRIENFELTLDRTATGY